MSRSRRERTYLYPMTGERHDLTWINATLVDTPHELHMKQADLLSRYDRPLPRYTSYPTAPHFSAAVDGAQYARWLADLPADAPISLYLHVPFCDRLCLYCGCNTAVVRHEAPRRAYAKLMMRELCQVADAIGRRATVSHVHWGGGTPTTLPADCLIDIMDLVRTRFTLLANAEVAIELDPTRLPADRVAAFGRMGITRASLGVQDLDPDVQKAIGRMQSYEETEACAQALRGLGIGSINLDLIYGLPMQTAQSVQATARRALDLGADRIAVFGYAHVPWMKKHQALIPQESLPGTAARFAQRQAIDVVLQKDGLYVPVGLDHYARPMDAMALAARDSTLHRSFQGYTTDSAPSLVGIGASAIGCLPQGYVQNETTTASYTAAMQAHHFPTARGIAMTGDDRLRRDVIERIMCDLAVDLDAVAHAHGADPRPLRAAAQALASLARDGLVTQDAGQIVVTPTGRPFVRHVAAVFDAYLDLAPGTSRHSNAV
jgi:oxygen-independent coproporphyrinogen-3 oxidase